MSIALQPAHDELLRAFAAPSPDLSAIRGLLVKLKIALTEASLLVPSAETSVEDIVLARDVLEVGAFWSIRVKDVDSFDRYIDLLRVYYNDYASLLPPSSNQEPLLGLSLLRLLSSNAISAFHTALETLSSEVVRDSPYIQHPINLERWLMEGSYSKVWSAGRDAPREEYRFFVDGLMGTIRDEIASCEEKAYDSLPFSDAATLLFFDNFQDMSTFANKRGWQLNPITQIFTFPHKPADGVNRDDIPRKATITSNLQFAKELESIV